jgi:hypothetical protein
MLKKMLKIYGIAFENILRLTLLVKIETKQKGAS